MCNKSHYCKSKQKQTNIQKTTYWGTFESMLNTRCKTMQKLMKVFYCMHQLMNSESYLDYRYLEVLT